MLVMGIDIAFDKTGISLMEVSHEGKQHIAGVWGIESQKGAPPGKAHIYKSDIDCQRAQYLASEVRKLVADWGPLLIVVELPHGGAKGARAARCMGIATGVIGALGAVWKDRGYPVIRWITPGDGKVAALGKKSGSKAEVIKAISERYPGFDWDSQKAKFLEHICDSVAAILAVENCDVWLALLGGKKSFEK